MKNLIFLQVIKSNLKLDYNLCVICEEVKELHFDYIFNQINNEQILDKINFSDTSTVDLIKENDDLSSKGEYSLKKLNINQTKEKTELYSIESDINKCILFYLLKIKIRKSQKM